MDKKYSITIRMTEEQRAIIEKRAAQNNMSINKYAIASMLEQMDHGSKFTLCQILVRLLATIDKLPDSNKKDKLRKECSEVWLSLK